MRLVCDTNILITGLVADGLCRDLVRRRLPKHQLFTSEALLAELDEKLRNKFGTNSDDVPFIKVFRDRATLMDGIPLPKPTCRDRNDDQVLAVAVAAKADAIVTGDKDLLILRQHAEIPILSPRQLVELLDA